MESSFRLVLTFYLHFAALKLRRFDVRCSSCRELTVARSAAVFMFRPNEDSDYFIKRAELGLVFVVPRTESDWRFSLFS